VRFSSFILTLSFIILVSACSPTANRSSFAQRAQSSRSEVGRAQSDSTPATALVKAKKANLREGPSRSDRVVIEVKKNDRLNLVTSSPVGPWYRVRETTQGAEGWIHGSLITVKQASPPLPLTEGTREVKSVPPTASGRSYINVDRERVPSPVFSETRPSGATARCRDGSYSFSRNRRGTCSHHGGVAVWY
jgi:uncharacterized protein YgiM (DUF1202 family)